MAIHLKPEERIIAFRIDGGPWWFDEGFLKLWVAVGEATEGPVPLSANPPDSNGKEPSQCFLKILGISTNGHSSNGNLL